MNIQAKTYKILIGILLLIGSLGLQLNASHVVGGQLTYRCLGYSNDTMTIEVILEFRRDCINSLPGSEFDNPVSIGIFDTDGFLLSNLANAGELFIFTNQNDTLNEIQTSECKIIGEDVCVETTTYIRELKLPYRESGYILSYQRCCRNSTVTNIVDPTFQGSTYWVEITGIAQQECNSSAQFLEWPPVYLCANDDFVFDHSAIDVDGDSLVYTLCTPYIGGSQLDSKPQPPAGPPYNNVVWAQGYGLDSLMGSDGTPLTIDEETGLILANPPDLGQYLVGVCVEEYRNGVLINRTIRDFQNNVRICLDNPIAEFVPSDTINCSGFELSFSNSSSPDASYLWYFDYPNTDLTSLEQNPTFEFPAAGYYEVALFVDEEGCIDSSFQTIAVSTPDQINFSLDYTDCLDSVFVYIEDTIVSDFMVTDINWTIVGPDSTWLVNGPLDSIGLGAEGDYIFNIELTNELGCVIDTSQLFTFDLTSDDPMVNFMVDYVDCQDELVITLDDDISSTTDIVSIQWTIEGMDTLIVIDGEAGEVYLGDEGVYTISLFAQNSLGCNQTFTDQFEFELNDSDPIVDFDLSYLECLDSLLINLMDLVTTTDSIINQAWTIIGQDTSLTLPGDATEVELINYGSYIISLYAETSLGCNNTYIDTVEFIQDIIDFDIEDDIIVICGETDVLLNPDPNPDYTYLWTSDIPGIIIEPTAATQELTLDQTVVFYVTAFLGDCRAHDTVLVDTQELEVELIDDENDVYYFCEGDAVTLEASSNAAANFEWFDENGELLGSGSPYSFFPDSAMQLTLIAANEAMCTDTAYFDVIPYLFDGEIIGDDFVCLQELFQLEIINTEDSLQNFTFTWVPFPDGGSGTQVEYQISEDTDVLVVVQNQFGCDFELNYTIKVDTFETLFINAEPDEILLQDSTQLFVEELPGATYEWSPEESLNDPNISDPIAFPENDDIIYTVTVTNENGCTAVASIPVSVIEPECNETDIFVPNTFTPNGDNFNDTFAPISNFIDLMDLVIYNRWGEEVFKSTDPNEGWDGTFDGEQLEPDVFGFHLSVLCIGGETYVKQGSITLMK